MQKKPKLHFFKQLIKTLVPSLLCLPEPLWCRGIHKTFTPLHKKNKSAELNYKNINYLFRLMKRIDLN